LRRPGCHRKGNPAFFCASSPGIGGLPIVGDLVFFENHLRGKYEDQIEACSRRRGFGGIRTGQQRRLLRRAI